MWTVIKFNKKNFHLMKRELMERNIGITNFYQPLIKVQEKKGTKCGYKEFSLLGNYIFCFNQNFANENFIYSLKNIRGIEYILNGYQSSQIEIRKFINKCKNSQNKEGFLSYKFYDLVLNKKYQFTTGPLANSIFQIINIKKNKIDVAVNSLKISLYKNQFNFKTI